MNMKLTAAAAATIILGAGFALPSFAASNNTESVDGLNVQKLVKVTSKDGLNPKVLKEALNGYLWAEKNHKIGKNKNTLTVVDYTQPSYKKRMYVLNLKNDTVLMQLRVAQGKNSGLMSAVRTSNRSGSDETSSGVIETSNYYHGEHGLSMRLNGLEAGVNNNVRSRAIVIHSAWYATPSFVKKYGRMGRSWGCLAVNPAKKVKFLHLVQNGSIIFGYAKAENHDPVAVDGPITIA